MRTDDAGRWRRQWLPGEGAVLDEGTLPGERALLGESVLPGDGFFAARLRKS